MQPSADSLLQQIKKHKSGSVFAKILVSWYQKNRRDWPWRSYFVQQQSPYPVWVSEIMLQQTTIQAVLPAYQRFFETFPQLQDLAAASEEEVRLACRGLGYYRRFRMMHQAAKELLTRKKTNGEIDWPRDFASWRALPGIGDYTAAAISSIAFDIPKAVVDGNVERVFCRIFDLRVVPDSRLKRLFQEVGDQLIVGSPPGDFNQGLMELGQTICTKQSPRCDQCPLQPYCAAYRQGSQALAPQAKKPPAYEDVRMHIVLLQKGKRIALAERKSSARFLKGTLGFPAAIEQKGKWEWETMGTLSKTDQPIGQVKHSITKHKIQAVIHIQKAEKEADFFWVPIDEIESRLVSNLDRKALQLLIAKSRRKRTPLETYLH